VDAACINQQDKDERGRQVQLMAKIYASANRVIFWLEEVVRDSDQALGALGEAAEEQHTRSVADKPNQQCQQVIKYYHG
ncbi:hypothetical protein B0T26DRAFT_643571, partial [Lasiosphaeria miniovina]